MRFSLLCVILSIGLLSAQAQNPADSGQSGAGQSDPAKSDLEQSDAGQSSEPVPDTVENDETVKQESNAPDNGVALTIGSVAPALDIEHWIHDGNGQFDPVTRFRPGKVYVLEFWASWCAPCVAAMPHIAALQQQYADDVQIISVTRENLDVVDQFLNRKIGSRARAKKAQTGDEVQEEPRDEDSKDAEEDAKRNPTYRDLTSVYCLASDPDESTSNDYMVAAGQNGIPCAFLIGVTGRVEWIGHPMLVDEPLREVINGTWDREAFGNSFRSAQKADLIQEEVVRLMRKGNVVPALELIESGLSDDFLSEKHDGLHTLKLQVLVSSEDHEEEAVDYLLERLSDPKHTASTANDLAWTIYRYADAGRFEDDEVTKKALDLAQSKVKGAGETKPYILDTVAHLLYLRGKIDEAIDVQRQAVALVKKGEDKDIEEFLIELLEHAEE